MKTRKNSNYTPDRGQSLKRLVQAVGCVVLAGAPIFFLGPGCNTFTGDGDDGLQTRGQGITVTTAVSAASDADAFRFEIDRVSCDDGSLLEANVNTKERGLDDMLLPGGIPQFENAPYDEDSGHLFADQYFVLDEGCYDVAVTPLKSVGGALSEDCVGASASGVEVHDGLTTEIHLISQCGNDPVGGLDVIASLNHAPQIEGLVFQPSKFTKACVPTTVCFTASDPDHDPLEVEWTITSGDGDAVEGIVTSTSQVGNEITECIELTADAPGTFEWEATVYDLLWDESTGELIRFETYYANRGEDRSSSDSLEFPIHVGENADEECEIDDGPNNVTSPGGNNRNNDTNNATNNDTNNATNNDTNNATNNDTNNATNNGTNNGTNGGTNGDDCPETCLISKTRAGPQYADITVEFKCDELHVTSSKDLSNVVLLFADGKTQKFDGLSGMSDVFAGTGIHAGKTIVGAWVKSGAFLSGDGPGFGEAFDIGACTY